MYPYIFHNTTTLYDSRNTCISPFRNSYMSDSRYTYMNRQKYREGDVECRVM